MVPVQADPALPFVMVLELFSHVAFIFFTSVRELEKQIMPIQFPGLSKSDSDEGSVRRGTPRLIAWFNNSEKEPSKLGLCCLDYITHRLLECKSTSCHDAYMP